MFKPNLIVIAGCNGSGKSTYSRSLLLSHILPFDADKRKKEIYDSFKFDFEFRERAAWNKTQNEFESEVETAIQNKKDFAFETNFHHAPFYWISKFKKAGYSLHMIFFSLSSIKLAIERVAIRFQSGGHYVPDNEVKLRYEEGFSNLDKHFKKFDSIMILESSIENKKPKTVFLFKDSVIAKNAVPQYFKRNCPKLTKYFISKN